jgi:RNA polymerase sigma-70 factor, ECF subfamily
MLFHSAAQETIASAVDGARPSFEELYDEHADFVARALARLGVRDANLDDAIQDVFVVVFRRMDEFGGRSLLRTWLYGIVLNVARNRRRTLRRRPEQELPEDDMMAPVDGADTQIARAEGLRTLYEILDSLDDDKREAFVLFELEELSAPEIAEALSLNLNTVYARVRAARKAFELAVSRRFLSSRRTAP